MSTNYTLGGGVYEISANPKYPNFGADYAAYGVFEGQRFSFDWQGNRLTGNIVGCGSKSLLVYVDALSF